MSSEPYSTGRTERLADVPVFATPRDVLCPAQELLGRKWHPVICYHLLANDALSFSDLKDSIDGISSKMLSDSLGDLEERGLVDRELLSDQPLRVAYSLTERGRTLESLVVAMVRWGRAQRSAEEPAATAAGGGDR
ncbi:winged helix-turn-helix transcriptional regulator [Halobacteriales archaeon Cl-PHB]